MSKNFNLLDDSELFDAIANEAKRQEDHIELIASENYTSPNVMRAQGSILTNKYAEGYPGVRYYGGCEYVDVVEELAINRAKMLFDAEYANVQPHSGSSANAAVYAALMQPGDTIMGLSLNHGGHLTHGSPVNFSGKIYNSVSYELSTATELLDYDAIESLAKAHKPKVIVAGYSAYPRVIDWVRLKGIADMVGAFLHADIAHIAGLICTGLFPSPLPYADVVTSTTHKTLRGPRGGIILSNNQNLFKKLNSVIFPGYQGGPLMHVIAAKAVAFLEALQPDFKLYQEQVLSNARVMSQTLQSKGISLVSGGTDTHLMLISLIDKNLTGKEVEGLLGSANITTNKNTVPNDPKSPFVTSGIRIGTPAITTRGFKNQESILLAELIADIINNPSSTEVIENAKKQVRMLTKEHPVYLSEA